MCEKHLKLTNEMYLKLKLPSFTDLIIGHIDGFG